MDSGDDVMGRYLEKKSGIIWVILTLLLFFDIFGAILGELVLAFTIVVVIGLVIWIATIIRKQAANR